MPYILRQEERSGGCRLRATLASNHKPSEHNTLRIKRGGAKHSSLSLREFTVLIHILHGFSRRTLRKPEDSLANNAKRLSIFRIWARACIVFVAFGTSLLCSASSCFHTMGAPFGDMFTRGRAKENGKIEKDGEVGEQTRCGQR